MTYSSFSILYRSLLLYIYAKYVNIRIRTIYLNKFIMFRQDMVITTTLADAIEIDSSIKLDDA